MIAMMMMMMMMMNDKIIKLKKSIKPIRGNGKEENIIITATIST